MGAGHFGGSPTNTLGTAQAPLVCHPKTFYASGETDPLSPSHTWEGRCGAMLGFLFPHSPFTTGPCVLQGISRPVLPSSFLQTQNSPRAMVGGCRGRRFLFLRRHLGCWGKYRDSRVGMSRGNVGAAAGADLRRGSGASPGCPAPCLEHSSIPHFATSVPVWGWCEHPGHVAASLEQSGVSWGPSIPGGSPCPPLHAKQKALHARAARGVPVHVPLFPRKCW